MNQIKSSIKSIGIIGGGTAGYLTALCIRKVIPSINITLIESLKIPVIGVGEATTPKIMRILHDVLEVDIKTFIEEVKPSWKLGIKFFWGKPAPYFFNLPFGYTEPYFAKKYTGDINNSSLVSELMTHEKSVVFRQAGSEYKMYSQRSFAYHLENKIFIQFLKKLLDRSGVNHLDREVITVEKKGESIDYILTDQGEKLAFDLFIDCSGFKSILLGGALSDDFISYRKSLFTDRAVTGRMAHNNVIKPYTSAHTMNHGWAWNIPLYNNDHLGYVYASDYCSDEEARQEFKMKFPEAIFDNKIIHFKSGRYKSFYKSNVVAIGNAYGFVEPLESTGLHMIGIEIIELIKLLKKGSVDEQDKKSINHEIGKSWDMLRWFLAIHFKFNKRKNSAFWKDCQQKVDVSGVQSYLDYFKETGPISFAKRGKIWHELSFDEIFSPVGFDALLLAQDIDPSPSFSGYLEHEKNQFLLKHKTNQHIINQAIPMKEALDVIRNNPDIFSLEDWFDKTF